MFYLLLFMQTVLNLVHILHLQHISVWMRIFPRNTGYVFKYCKIYSWKSRFHICVVPNILKSFPVTVEYQNIIFLQYCHLHHQICFIPLKRINLKQKRISFKIMTKLSKFTTHVSILLTWNSKWYWVSFLEVVNLSLSTKHSQIIWYFGSQFTLVIRIQVFCIVLLEKR